MSGGHWTKAELDQLRRLWPERMSLTEISEALGRSVYAIRTKRKRLGLPAKGHLGIPQKLTEEEARAIRILVAGKMMSRQGCAALFGVDQSMVNHIAAGRRWAWLSAEVAQ